MAFSLANRTSDRKILRVLIAGFALVISLLAAAAAMALFNVQSIRESAGALVREQSLTTRLIEDIQREQGALSAVFHKFAGDPDSLDRDETIAQLDETDRAIHVTVSSASGTAEERLWRELELAANRFTREVRLAMSLERGSNTVSGTLVRRHEDVISVVSKLISASQQRASTEQKRIEKRSRDLLRESLAALGASILLALLCAILTVRIATELFRKMEWQAGELSRVSWHMLERQETTARRFSHELHDELGQSLAAVKANLVALDRGSGESKERREDCLHLVEEAIGNVRELSQLLRPTILDDFGLDASLRWLAERFTQRTGIHVKYESSFDGRLKDEAETHLFRIAQEALTNVARHSGAAHVHAQLAPAGSSIRLTIADDGKGLPEPLANSGLGMIGMRARARSAGGELVISSPPGGGVQVEVCIPAELKVNETENSSLARR